MPKTGAPFWPGWCIEGRLKEDWKREKVQKREIDGGLICRGDACVRQSNTSQKAGAIEEFDLPMLLIEFAVHRAWAVEHFVTWRVQSSD